MFMHVFVLAHRQIRLIQNPIGWVGAGKDLTCRSRAAEEVTVGGENSTFDVLVLCNSSAHFNHIWKN